MEVLVTQRSCDLSDGVPGDCLCGDAEGKGCSKRTQTGYLHRQRRDRGADQRYGADEDREAVSSTVVSVTGFGQRV